MSPAAAALLADAILALHAGIVAFVVLGTLAILAGGPLGWRWVRSGRSARGHAPIATPTSTSPGRPRARSSLS